jgi:uncharacterized protein (TIGR03000 family)
MRKALTLTVFALGSVLAHNSVGCAQEQIVHPPRPAAPVEAAPHFRWSPAATDGRYLLWNDWQPAFYPGVYEPGWGGWWYSYFGHTYSPFFSPYLHDYPFHRYTHPYYNYPLEEPWGRDIYIVKKPTPAKVVVSLPADAKLIVNGQPTELTSAERVFTTPDLKPGKDYYYVLKAEVVRDGEVKTLTKEVAVSAGRQSKVEFDLPTATTARK